VRIQELRNKRVAIWGLGSEGWSTLKLLRKKFPANIITVLNDSVMSPEMEITLNQDPFLNLVSGENIAKALQDIDVVIKSPGVSMYKEEIQNAKEKGVYFTSSTKLWFQEHINDKTVCVTGSKGKSTTSSLITHLLRNAGKRVTLGGNFGTPMLDMLEVEPKPDIWVMELSSYQLSDLDTSPTVSLLLNLFPEHLDWHKNLENYYKDKLNLFTHQTEKNIAILNKTDENTSETVKKLKLEIKNVRYFNEVNAFHISEGYICEGEKKLFPTNKVSIPGNHNLSNICAALTVVKALGIEPEKCIEALSTFKGLPHRLYPWGLKDEVLYVDDSISTTPQSAIAAMETHADKAITILLGGFDRGLNFEDLAKYIVSKNIPVVLTMPDNGVRIAETIKKEMNDNDSCTTKLIETESLKEAVKIAQELTPKGGIVLLSPGSPSYGHFKNFAERGDTFARLAGFEA
jgi:UDP-N-acetylmuramoylalanine--D-glutamate ligase